VSLREFAGGSRASQGSRSRPDVQGNRDQAAHRRGRRGADPRPGKSQLFHYFPDGKSDLLLAVAQYEAEQILTDQQPMLGDLTSWPKWQAWRQRVIDRYAAQGRHCPLSALTSQLGLADPATEAIITDMYDRWLGYLVAGVKALLEAGEIDRDTDPGQAAGAILAAVTGGATLLQATGRISYLQASLTETLNGLRATPGR
jgi:AcrR family transcriptional regulator